MNLEVAVGNNTAARLCERLGYRRVGEPVMDRWQQPTNDGRGRWVEELCWTMVKDL